MAVTPLPEISGVTASGPVVLCIMDGVGLGRSDDGNAVWVARTPVLSQIASEFPWVRIAAHGRAVGLPSDEDMGNSEVGHNALGAGRIFEQGASLVNAALDSGSAFAGETWPWLIQQGTLHLLGLVSDGNVHSHVDHLHALIRRAAADGVERLRVHVLTDGRDVTERSAMTWILPLEALLLEIRNQGRDYAIGSGGGRMHLTMDRYEAEWDMVQRGWDCHVLGQGRAFSSAQEAIETLYAENPEVTDQWLPAFVIRDSTGAPCRMREGDGVLFFNFRGDRAVEISAALEGRDVPIDRGNAPSLRFAGMMQYDGDTLVPQHFLVDPPAIDRTVGDYLCASGKRSYAISETQKFGHVTFFFNGNRSGYIDPELETYEEIPSDVLPFEKAPAMKAAEIATRACAAIRSGDFDHVRLNFANGDMVGHTGDFDATVLSLEIMDTCVGEILSATREMKGVLLLTADHGNADQMYQLDKATGDYQIDEAGKRVPRTSHSTNPVPFFVCDFTKQWRLVTLDDAGLGHVSASILTAMGLVPPDDYLPSLVQKESL